MTFNILHGRSPVDGLVDPARLLSAVKRFEPDVLALQEVDHRQQRSGDVDFTQIAAEAMDAVDSRFVATVAGIPGSVWTAPTGEESPDAAAYGIALLSRIPVTGWQVTHLPRPKVALPAKQTGRWHFFASRDEPRAAVTAQIQLDGASLTVTNTHLSFLPGWNVRQLVRVMRAVRGLPGPRILMGDLNLTPSAVERVTGWRTLARGATYPAHDPVHQLDHVLTDDPTRLVAVKAEIAELGLSDHRAVVVDMAPDPAAFEETRPQKR